MNGLGNAVFLLLSSFSAIGSDLSELENKFITAGLTMDDVDRCEAADENPESVIITSQLNFQIGNRDPGDPQINSQLL